MVLISKLTAVNKYRAGNSKAIVMFHKQWGLFVNYLFIIINSFMNCCNNYRFNHILLSQLLKIV